MQRRNVNASLSSSPTDSDHPRNEKPARSKPSSQTRNEAMVRPRKGGFRWVWRNVLAKPTRLLPFLVVPSLLVVGTAAIVLRTFWSETLITVDAFEMHDEQVKVVGGDGKSFADKLVDDLQSVIRKADQFTGNDFSSKRQYDAIPDAPHIPVRRSFRGAGIKGVSIDQVDAVCEYLRYPEYNISGDLKSV